MSIRARQTRLGTVYDALFRIGGRHSKQLCKTFDRKNDAREFLAQMKMEQRDNSLGIDQVGRFEDRKLGEEARFWLEQMQVQMSPGWRKRSSAIINSVLVPQYGHLTLDKFTVPFVRKMQGELKLHGRQNSSGPLRNASVNRMTEVLCAILNYAVKARRIPFNPAKGYSKLPDDRSEISYWEVDEARDFLRFVSEQHPAGSEDRWVYAALLVAINCGLRAGELWGLMPSDIREETLYIKRQWIEVEKRFELPKGKRNRKSMDRQPYRHTVLHQTVRTELLDVVRQRDVRIDQTIFYGDGGKPRGHVSFAKRFHRLVKAWGGRRIRFHDLRHTAITLWVHAGINLRVIQEMAGHENITTTMGYVHMVGGSVNRVSQVHLVTEKSNLKLLPQSPESDDVVRSDSAKCVTYV